MGGDAPDARPKPPAARQPRTAAVASDIISALFLRRRMRTIIVADAVECDGGVARFFRGIKSDGSLVASDILRRNKIQRADGRMRVRSLEPKISLDFFGYPRRLSTVTLLRVIRIKESKIKTRPCRKFGWIYMIKLKHCMDFSALDAITSIPVNFCVCV